MTGIINAEDVRDDDWILLEHGQLQYANVLGCRLGRSRAVKVMPIHDIVGPNSSPKFVLYARRVDYKLITALQRCTDVPVLVTYAFPAVDTDITEEP